MCNNRVWLIQSYPVQISFVIPSLWTKNLLLEEKKSGFGKFWKFWLFSTMWISKFAYKKKKRVVCSYKRVNILHKDFVEGNYESIFTKGLKFLEIYNQNRKENLYRSLVTGLKEGLFKKRGHETKKKVFGIDHFFSWPVVYTTPTEFQRFDDY